MSTRELQQRPAPAPLEEQASLEERRGAFWRHVEMVAADGEVAEVERVRLDAIALELEIPRAEVDLALEAARSSAAVAPQAPRDKPDRRYLIPLVAFALVPFVVIYESLPGQRVAANRASARVESLALGPDEVGLVFSRLALLSGVPYDLVVTSAPARGGEPPIPAFDLSVDGGVTWAPAHPRFEGPGRGIEEATGRGHPLVLRRRGAGGAIRVDLKRH